MIHGYAFGSRHGSDKRYGKVILGNEKPKVPELHIPHMDLNEYELAYRIQPSAGGIIMNRNLRGDGIEFCFALHPLLLLTTKRLLNKQRNKGGTSGNTFTAWRSRNWRNENQIDRLTRQSKLPERRPWQPLIYPVCRIKYEDKPTLCEGNFLKRAENILAFGLPGRGKSHLVCGFIKRGYKVLFLPAYRLVQSTDCKA